MKCNNCGSENTVIKNRIENMEKEEKNYGRKMTFDEIYYCKCQDCNSIEELNHWKRVYTIYNEPLIGTVIGDVEILAKLTNGDPRTEYSTIELISLKNSEHEDEKTYLLCNRCDRSAYPIKVMKEKAELFLQSLNELYNCNIIPKDYSNMASFYFNTTLSRRK